MDTRKIDAYFSKQTDEDFNVIPKTKDQALSEFYEKYPQTEWWRLAVDGQIYDTGQFGEGAPGWTTYAAREENCIRSFLTALEFCLNYQSITVTTDFIKELHKIVEKDIPDSRCGRVKSDELRTLDTGFYIETIAVTQEGLADLFNQLEKGYLKDVGVKISVKGNEDSSSFKKEITSINLNDIRKAFNCNDNTELAICLLSINPLFKYLAPAADQLEKLLSDALAMHYQALQKAINLDEKLEVVGKTIERLERIHPFNFANGRTFVNLLLNYFLVEMGLPPATFYQPSLFDAYGNHVNVIKKAVMNTVAIYDAYDKKENVKLFGVESANIFAEGYRKQAKDIKKEMDDIIEAAHIEYKRYILEKCDFINNHPDVLLLFKRCNFTKEELNQKYSSQGKTRTFWDNVVTQITEFNVQLLLELLQKGISPPPSKIWNIKRNLEEAFAANLENHDFKTLLLKCHGYIANCIFDLEKKDQAEIVKLKDTKVIVNKLLSQNNFFDGQNNVTNNNFKENVGLMPPYSTLGPT